jgi:hypothetical protein
MQKVFTTDIEFNQLYTSARSSVRLSSSAAGILEIIGDRRDILVSNRKIERIDFTLKRVKRTKSQSYYASFETMSVVNLCRQDLKKYFPYRTKNLYIKIL